MLNYSKRSLSLFIKSTLFIIVYIHVLICFYHLISRQIIVHSTFFSLLLISQLNIPPKRIRIYSVGQPRIGNAAFVEFVNHINIDMYRLVNSYDLITHIPPRSLGFSHLGTEIWFVDSEVVKDTWDDDDEEKEGKQNDGGPSSDKI